MPTRGLHRRTVLMGAFGLVGGLAGGLGVAGCTAAGSPTASGPQSTPTLATPTPATHQSWTFRAMTYNILSGARPPSAFPRVEPRDLLFENRLPVLAEWITHASPDVLGIQENERMRAPIHRPLRRLLPLLDGYRAVQADTNIPIVYRAAAFEPLASGIRVISTQRHVRYGTWCRLRHSTTGDQILVANTHLDPHQGEDVVRVREASLTTLVAWLATINEDPNLPLVLCGDFNSPNDRDPDGHIHGMAPLYESGLRNSADIAAAITSAVPGAATLNGMGAAVDGIWRYGAIRHDARMIDYIWVSPDVDVRAWQVITGPSIRTIDGQPYFAAGPVPSDHCPVLAEVRIGA